MRIAPWHDPRQMLSEVSPWNDWLFAKRISAVTAKFIAAGHSKGGKRGQRGRYPQDTPTPDFLIRKHVGGYDSNPASMSVARYHRIFDWTLAMGTSLLTSGRTKLLSKPPKLMPPASVLVSTVEWFRSRIGRTPEDKDFGHRGLPPMRTVRVVFGGTGGLILAANSLVGE